MKNFIKILCVSIFLIPAAHGMDVEWNSNHHLENRLIEAIWHRKFEHVLNLIKAKADVNYAASYGTTALMIAAMHGNLPTVQVLIDAKAHLSQADTNGCTALHDAAHRNHYDVCTQLVDALLKLPNKDQKQSIITFLGCGTKREEMRKMYGTYKDIIRLIGQHMLAACEEANRDNFVDSVAHQEIMKLQAGDVKNNLLEKYNPQPSNDSDDRKDNPDSETESSSWCSIQ